MKRLKGIVKKNVVMLDENVHLPDGTEVEVRVPFHSQKRDEAFRRILSNPITRYIGMDEIIEVDKKERDEHWCFKEPDDE